MWAEWYVEGDANPSAPKDVDLKSPFFNTSLKGGWFKPNEYLTSTLQGVDGPFALLLSHICATEYSVEAIKKDLKVLHWFLCVVTGFLITTFSFYRFLNIIRFVLFSQTLLPNHPLPGAMESKPA